MKRNAQRKHSRCITTGWRQPLMTLAPSLTGLPASMQAVNLLLLHRHVDAACAACDEMLAAGTVGDRALLSLSDRFRQSGDSKRSLHFRRLAYQVEMSNLGLVGHDLDSAVQFCLAADGFAAADDGDDKLRSPKGYVQAHFDRYAATFESRLVDELTYCGPEAVHRVLSARLASAFVDRRICDIGCGTGLAGPLFRPQARILDGLDLAPAMVQRARSKQVYDNLWVGDLAELLDQRGASYDLILAIDVLIYLGDLAEVFRSCQNALTGNGIFAATIETGATGYRLAEFRRFVHSMDYVREVSAAAGLALTHVEPVSIRRERGKALEFCVVLFRLADTESADSSG